jgi:hypothetical protein
MDNMEERPSWIVKRKLWNDMENMVERKVEIWNNMENMEETQVE